MTGYERKAKKALQSIKDIFAKKARSANEQSAHLQIEKYTQYFFHRVSENEKINFAAKSIMFLFASFASGCMPIYESIYPFSLALLIACNKFSLFIFLGSCLSCITYPSFSLVYFLSNIFIYTSKKILEEKKFKNEALIKSIFSCVFGVLIGISRFAAEGFSKSGIVFFMLFSLSLCAFTYIFSYLFEGEKAKNASLCSAMYCLSVSVLIFCSVKTASLFSFGLYNLAAILSQSLILIFANYGGVAFGSVCALLCSAALAMPESSLYYFASGIFTGLAYKKKLYIKIIIHLLCSFFIVLKTKDISALYYRLPSIFVSAFIFSICTLFMPEKYRMREEKKESFLPKSSGSFLELSKVFSSLSDMFFSLSAKQKNPEKEKIDDIIGQAFEKSCRVCSLCEHCFAKQNVDTKELSCAIYNCLICGNLSKKSIPEKLYKKCIKIDDIIDRINSDYSRLMESYFRNNKTEILAQQYSSVARIIKYTDEKESFEKGRDTELEKKVKSVLSRIEIKYTDVIATLSRPAVITVLGITPEKFPLSALELSCLISEKCKAEFSEPEYRFENGKCNMVFTQKPQLQIEYSQASCSKTDDEVNGDCISFFKNNEEFFYALISDGMGSGRTAALTSKLTSVFIEKFLTTGAQKSVTLELLNNLLLSKNDECFATVDLLEIDLLSKKASFIKAGAAPAYIVRTTKLYKIASATPPAGIIQGFCAENTSFFLESGDIIVMLSDGIVQSFDETPWLAEILSFDTKDNPCTLAQKILSKAKHINIRRDDMSVIVLKVV